MPQRKNDNRQAKPQLSLVSDESVDASADESIDERIERLEHDRRRRIEKMLATLPMSPSEKQFVVNSAEKVVDLICDDYVNAVRINHLNSQCISAAATVAAMIVDDS